MKLSFPIVLATAFAATAIDEADEQFSNGGANVVGGTTSAQGAYPYYSIPYYGSARLCGATLIHEDILLSAAHCEGTFSNVNVQIGGNLASGADAREVIRASIERVHPNFSTSTFEDDLMLIKLTKSSTAPFVPWNNVSSVPADGSSVKVIGFGRTVEDGVRSDVLQEANLNVVNFTTCNAEYGFLIESKMLCAAADGKDSCRGDSGGPLFSTDGTIVGIVSFGYGCARAGFAGVYARTDSSTAQDFIRTGICELSSNPPASCGKTPANSPVSSPVSTPTTPPVPAPSEAPTKTPIKSPTRSPAAPTNKYVPSPTLRPVSNPGMIPAPSITPRSCNKCVSFFFTGKTMHKKDVSKKSCTEVCVLPIFSSLWQGFGFECGPCAR